MLKWLLGVFLWPASLGMLLAAAGTMGGLISNAGAALPFLLGFLGYPLIRLYVSPSRLYVLGHELSHAAAAWMSGTKVLSFFAGSREGHVRLSGSNAFIALAPYVLPFYAMAVMLGYRLLLWFWHPSPAGARCAQEIFLALAGLALSFHLVHTAEAVGTVRQPDLDQAGGMVFSLAVIALCNGAVLVLTLKCLFPRLVSVTRTFRMTWGFAWPVWSGVFSLLKSGTQNLKKLSPWSK